MALQLKLKNTNNINPEGTRIYLEDATGVYSATNLGGYGGIDPVTGFAVNAGREDLALLVLGLNKTTKGDSLIAFESYNPLITDKFNAIVGVDGWYHFSLISLPIYDEVELANYILGDILYDPILGVIVKIIQTENIAPVTEATNPLEPTEPITSFVRSAEPITLLELKDSEYVFATTEVFFIANNSKTKLKINSIISDLIQTGITSSDRNLIRHKGNYNVVRAILQGAIYEFCRGNKFVAQKDIEFLNTNNYVSE